LLASLRNAERDINREYKLDLRVAAYNFGSPLDENAWSAVERDLENADIVFVVHVMDGENGARLLVALERYQIQHRAVVVINCMPELMRRTRLGKFDARRFLRSGPGEGETERRRDGQKGGPGNGETRGRNAIVGKTSDQAVRLLGTVGSWIGRQAQGRRKGKTDKHGHGQYLKFIDKLPGILRFMPTAGTLSDIKNYLYLFCYFLQPTPANIRSMILYVLKEYVPEPRLREIRIKIPPPERMPSVAIYHPDSSRLFETYEAYENWYSKRRPKSKGSCLDPNSTIGLLLMRPQVVSKTTKHYDALIHAIEDEGLSVIPAISTLMDNREACQQFFIDAGTDHSSNVQRPTSKDQRPKAKGQRPKTKNQTTDNRQLPTDKSRVSQILSLTGFSFVGGPAMNDSLAASVFLSTLSRPYRSAVSLDTQTIEAWRESQTGLNPIQAGMQIAIPEIDGATEPLIYGGIPAAGVEPAALEDRCRRLARRLRRGNRLRTAPRGELRLALVLFCFPPNKGNIGTAADLDVFPSIWDTLEKLKADGYDLDLPASPEDLRNNLLGGNSEKFGATANVAYRMNEEEYRGLCPYVAEIEQEWGRAPGRINSLGRDLLIQGIKLGKVFVGVQPTFGYEGDPMRLMMARGGAPHHGFMAFYTYLSAVLGADAVIHVGTHGSLEFMPGKQVGLSGDCWPDRLIGELPNFYLYSVNNPSEGSIARRRSYAELISYLTPPLENAGLYKDLGGLKDLVMAYRQATDERERENLFAAIDECSRSLNFGGVTFSQTLKNGKWTASSRPSS
jgi:magnesium chelatase subunit H